LLACIESLPGGGIAAVSPAKLRLKPPRRGRS
jgi:hypothetical protein